MSSISNILLLLATLSQLTEMVQSIVGGSKAGEDDYPYFVQLGPSCAGCGGALIAPDTVLFAAHCPDYEKTQIIIGSYRTQSLANGAQARFCEKHIRHPKFEKNDKWAPDWDVALCKLDSPVYIDESKVKLELNNDGNIPADNDELIVMGLGLEEHGEDCPNFLKDAKVSAYPNDKCQDQHETRQVDPPVEVTDQMLCADSPGENDTCPGDSGAPIVKRVRRGSSFVDYHVGLSSWGEFCGQNDKASGYARTSAVVDWINKESSNYITPPAPCRDHEENLHIFVKTGSLPEDISWTLTEQGGSQIMSVKGYILPNYENNHQVCVGKDSCYSFKIKDECSWGSTSYELGLYGQKSFDSGRTSDYSKTTKFCVKDLAPKCNNIRNRKLPAGIRNCSVINRKNKPKRQCKRNTGNQNGEIVADICLATCGKLGVGKCKHLED